MTPSDFGGWPGRQRPQLEAPIGNMDRTVERLHPELVGVASSPRPRASVSASSDPRAPRGRSAAISSDGTRTTTGAGAGGRLRRDEGDRRAGVPRPFRSRQGRGCARTQGSPRSRPSRRRAADPLLDRSPDAGRRLNRRDGRDHRCKLQLPVLYRVGEHRVLAPSSAGSAGARGRASVPSAYSAARRCCSSGLRCRSIAQVPARAPRQVFSFARPRRTQVFTVPSGSRRCCASSECDRPS